MPSEPGAPTTKSAGFTSTESFIDETIKYVKEGAARGIPLRIVGGVGIYVHSMKEKELWTKLDRLPNKVFPDVDYASRSNYSQKILELFESLGYAANRSVFLLHGDTRAIFYGDKIPVIDVFMDKLNFCHPIDLRKRLEIDNPTIPLADLLLQKLQIVQLNEKDVKDTILLLKAHELGAADNETINIEYVAKLLSDDWGFNYTVATNLDKVKQYLVNTEALASYRDEIFGKIEKINKRTESEPKSMRWKLRAKVGARSKWYQDVSDVAHTEQPM